MADIGSRTALPAFYYPNDFQIGTLFCEGVVANEINPMLITDRIGFTLDQVIARWRTAESTAGAMYLTIVRVADGVDATTAATFLANGVEMISPSQRVSLKGTANTNNTIIPDKTAVVNNYNTSKIKRSTGTSGANMSPGETIYVAAVNNNTGVLSTCSLIDATELAGLFVQIRYRSQLS